MIKKKIKFLLKVVLAFLFYYTGVYRFLIKIKGHRHITYHNIIPDVYFDETVHLGVSHSEYVLRRQLKILSKCFGKDNIQITFDDGYLNNLKVAIPILDEFNIKGKFFVPLSKDEKSEPFWIDKLMYFFSYAVPGTYFFDNKEFVLTSENRFLVFGQFFFMLNEKYHKKNEMMKRLDEYLALSNIKIPDDYYKLRFSFISNESYKEIIDSGHFLGFHGLNHDVYSKLSLLEIENELKTVMKEVAEYNIKSFSFPFGGKEEISFDSISLLESYGFNEIYSNSEEIFHDKVLPRISLPNTSNKYLVLAYYTSAFGR